MTRFASIRILSCASAVAAFLALTVSPRAAELENLPPDGAGWKRHIIDDGTHGSDGTKLADINGDGLPDIVTSWENEGITRVYLNPGFQRAGEHWPQVTIGKTPHAEDAVFVDLDLDGAWDVVSSQEQHRESVVALFGPTNRADLLKPGAWREAEFTAAHGVSMWMYAEPIHVRPGRPVDLVIGGKNYEKDESAWLGLLLAPKTNRQDTTAWTWQPLAKVSWVMSIEVLDMNGDGFDDILFSDKNGPGTGIAWLENPGASAATGAAWKRHELTPRGAWKGCNFLAVGDLDKDGLTDVIGLVDGVREPGAPDWAHRRVLFLRRLDKTGLNWETHEILVPPNTAQPKAVTVGDVNRDGHNDLVVTSTGAEGDLLGTYWLEWKQSVFDRVWRAHNISGPEGIKYDLVHLVDLNGDGAPDVLTSEEKEGGHHLGLGVFWYENPYK
jgi:hypothetical protein